MNEYKANSHKAKKAEEKRANYCMFRYMYPQNSEYFIHTDSSESAGIDGMSVKEIEEFKKENY